MYVELPWDIKEPLTEVSQMGKHEIARRVKSGEFIVKKNIRFPVRDVILPPLKDGWKLFITTPSNIYATRKIFIVPTDNHSRKIWLQGLTNIAFRAGLKIHHARTWARSTIREKHELLEELVAIMKNNAVIDAYLTIRYNSSLKHVQQMVWVHGLSTDTKLYFHRLLAILVRELVTGEVASRSMLSEFA